MAMRFFARSFVRSVVRSFGCAFVHSLTRLFVGSLVRPRVSVRSPVRSFNRSFADPTTSRRKDGRMEGHIVHQVPGTCLEYFVDYYAGNLYQGILDVVVKSINRYNSSTMQQVWV